MADFIKAIPVVPSATLNIPEPGSIGDGSSSTNGTTVTATALKNKARPGDVIQVSVTGSLEPIEIHQILNIETVATQDIYTLLTPVATAAPYDFKIYRSNGGSSLLGNSGYSLLVQLDNADNITFIPVGQTEQVSLTNNTNFSVQEVLSEIKIQRVVSCDASNIIALDTD